MNKHSFWRGKISIMLTLALLVSVIFVPVPKVKVAGEVTTVTINRTISRTSKDDILARINEIRLEFYNLNQQYHYVDDYTYTPIKWSSRPGRNCLHKSSGSFYLLGAYKTQWQVLLFG